MQAGEASPALPDTVPDPFLSQVTQAQAELAEAVERAGLGRDPYRFLVGALAHALGVFPVFVERLESAIEHARQPVDPAALARLEAAAASGAARRAAELARVQAWRTMLLYGGVFALGMMLATGGGFAWGRMSVQQTERDLVAAFADGPEAAATWATLMRNNNVLHSLSMCKGPQAYKDQNGRQVCLLPLYVETGSQP